MQSIRSVAQCYATSMVHVNDIPQKTKNAMMQKFGINQQLQQGGGVPEQFQQQQLPSGGTGSLNDACLQSGFTQQQCNSYFGPNPGGYCTTLQAAGLPCPQIQDPSFTYNNPEAARQESEQKKQRIQGAIEGYDRLYPPGRGLD